MQSGYDNEVTGFDETVPPDDDPNRDENATAFPDDDPTKPQPDDEQPPEPRTAAQLDE